MKNVVHSRGSFAVEDEIAEALVTLDDALRASDTVGRFEIATPGDRSDVVWIHLYLGDRVPLVVSSVDEREAEIPPRVLVPPGTVRQTPIEVRSFADEQVDPFGYDWL